MTGIDPVRVAIIGLGHIGRVHVDALSASRKCRLVAACDPESALASVLPEDVPFHLSYQDMLRQARFDVAVIATPNQTHYSIAVDVLQSGYDIILEKPSVSSLDEFDRMQKLARECGRSIYHAFHAACAREVSWVVDHIPSHAPSLGPLTAFASRFYDPYIDQYGRLEPHATALGDCWHDSGINALSVLDRVLPADRLGSGVRRQSGCSERGPGILSVSVHYAFCVTPRGEKGLGVIETAWDQGRHVKRTELYYGKTGWHFVVDHIQQSVVSHDPDGCQRILCSFGGERLRNHYHAVFSDYIECRTSGQMNASKARRVHAALFRGAIQ